MAIREVSPPANWRMNRSIDSRPDAFSTARYDVNLPRRGARARFLLVLLVPVLLLLSGCMVGPDYQRPKVAVSPNWAETGDQRVSTGSTTYRDWWRAFNDPALDRLIARAYRDNLTLQQAGVRVLQARAQLGIAVGEIYPADAAGRRVRPVQPDERSSLHRRRLQAAAASTYWQSQIGAQASWELDFWGRIRRGIESADASLLATLADYDNTLVTLTADVANTYIALRTAEERIRIARENVEIQEQTLKIVEARFKYGTVTQLDVEQARTVLLNTLATLPTLETQRRQARDALSVLLGMPPSDLSDLLDGPSAIPVSPPQVIVGIPADLLRRRPDIRSAELQAVAQSAQIGVARADLFPAFSLIGNLVLLSTDLGTFRLSDMFRWGSRSGPGRSLRAVEHPQLWPDHEQRPRAGRALPAAAPRLSADRCSSAQQDVEDNLVAFLRAQDRADLLAKSVTSSRNAVYLAVLQYREGVTDFTTVLTAQQTLLTQQDNLASTLGNISTSLVGVYRALGGGWEIREGEDIVPAEIKAEMRQRTNWGEPAGPRDLQPAGLP